MTLVETLNLIHWLPGIPKIVFHHRSTVLLHPDELMYRALIYQLPGLSMNAAR